jgi:hypothetical protein
MCCNISILTNLIFNIREAGIVLKSILNVEMLAPSFIHSVLYCLATIGITDLDTLRHFVKKYDNRQNQYIRAGLYKLLNSSDHLESFVKIYLDGLDYTKIKRAAKDREPINLSDESWNLEEGL